MIKIGSTQEAPQWENVIGRTGEQAKNIILQADSSLHVDILPEGSITTRDYRLDRVRVWVDGQGKVTHQPKRG